MNRARSLVKGTPSGLFTQQQAKHVRQSAIRSTPSVFIPQCKMTPLRKQDLSSLITKFSAPHVPAPSPSLLGGSSTPRAVNPWHRAVARARAELHREGYRAGVIGGPSRDGQRLLSRARALHKRLSPRKGR